MAGCVRISMSADSAQDISILNDQLNVTVEDNSFAASREGTPFEEEHIIVFELAAKRHPTYSFGTGHNNDFRLGACQMRDCGDRRCQGRSARSKTVSARHFSLFFEQNRAWILRDDSTNGTIVNGISIMSLKARRYAGQRKRPCDQPTALALHPTQRNRVQMAHLTFDIDVEGFVPDHVVSCTEPEIELLDLHSNTSIAPSLSVLASGQWDVSNQYYTVLGPDCTNPSTDKHLMNKLSGDVFMARVFQLEKEPGARLRYEVLKPILDRGKQQYLVQFLAGIMYEGFYTIVTTEMQSGTSWSQLRRRAEWLSGSEVSFVCREMLGAIGYLHSQKLSHNNISFDTILIGEGSPITSKLTGFDYVTDTRSTTTQDRRSSSVKAPRKDVKTLLDVVKGGVEDAGLTWRQCPLYSMVQTRHGRGANVTETILQSIDEANDGGDTWPFRPISFTREFNFRWMRAKDVWYVNVADLRKIITSFLHEWPRSFDISFQKIFKVSQRGNFQGQYVDQNTADTLLQRSAIRYLDGVLSPREGAFHTSVRSVTCFCYQHTSSGMVNVTQLLQTISSGERPKLLEDIQPNIIQEVWADPEWEGCYIDRDTILTILARANTIDVKIEMTVQEPRSVTKTLFQQASFVREVLIATRWSSPSWVTLNRRPSGCLDRHRFDTFDELRNWYPRLGSERFSNGLGDLRDITSPDWTYVPQILPSTGGSTPCPSSPVSSTRFRFGTRARGTDNDLLLFDDQDIESDEEGSSDASGSTVTGNIRTTVFTRSGGGLYDTQALYNVDKWLSQVKTVGKDGTVATARKARP